MCANRNSSLQLKWISHSIKQSLHNDLPYAHLILQCIFLLYSLIDLFIYIKSTVPISNTCTKCMGSPGIINDPTSDYYATQFLAIGAWITSQMNVALIRKLRGSLMSSPYFFEMLSMSVFNPALADVQSAGAGVECLYCMLFKSLSFQYPRITPSGTDFKPWMDGFVLPDYPEDIVKRNLHNNVTLMTGTVKDEWARNLGWFINELMENHLLPGKGCSI